MLSLKQKKYGFTLAETVIVCTMFAFVVVGVILAISRSFVFLDNTRIMVRAANYAREGVELVYNIRDTNRKRNSGEKDKYRTHIGDWSCATSNNCFLKPGVYAIKDKIIDGNTYYYAKKIDVSNIDDFYNDNFFNYEDKIVDAKLNYTGTYQYYDGNNMAYGSLEDLLSNGGVQFYRVLRVYGIYKKNMNSNEGPNDPISGDEYKDGTPAELRFCVKVYFRSRGAQDVELCSIMTNFEK